MFSRYPHILAFDVDTSFGKKNTYTDLRSDVDRSRVLELVRERDVFVQGFRWGSFARRGFGPEELAQINPRLIYVEVNAYGFQGPWAERRGWEQLAQATTGMADLRSAGREKSALVPVYFNDYSTGWLGALGVLTALLRRSEEGLNAMAQTGWFPPGQTDEACSQQMFAAVAALRAFKPVGPFALTRSLRARETHGLERQTRGPRSIFRLLPQRST